MKIKQAKKLFEGSAKIGGCLNVQEGFKFLMDIARYVNPISIRLAEAAGKSSDDMCKYVVEVFKEHNAGIFPFTFTIKYDNYSFSVLIQLEDGILELEYNADMKETVCNLIEHPNV